MNNEINVSQNASNNKLPINETLKEAWANTRGFKGICWVSFIVLMLIGIGTEMLSLSVSPGGFQSFFAHPPTPVHYSGSGFIIQLIGRIIYYLLFYGLVYMAIRQTKNIPITMSMFFSTFKYPRYLQVIGWFLIKLFLIGLSFALLILPSVLGMLLPHTRELELISGVIFILGIIVALIGAIYYVMLRLSMTSFAILDKGINPIAAMKLSLSATKGNTLRIFAIYIIISFIVLISMIPLGIGLIWSIPFAYLVYPAIYRRLVGISTNV